MKIRRADSVGAPLASATWTKDAADRPMLPRSAMRGRRQVSAALIGSLATALVVAVVAGAETAPLSPPLPPGGQPLFPFRLAARLVGLNSLPHDLQGEVAVLALALAGLGFLFALREAWRENLSLRVVLTLGVLFHIVVLLLPLLASQDVYQYGIYGRIAGVHHANPYLSPPKSFGNDPFFSLINPGWRNQVSPYGPGFILLARLITSISSRPETVVLAFKAVSALASLLTMALVATLARRRWPARAPFATALIALNPAVLFVVVGSGHNDSLIALLVVVAFWFGIEGAESKRFRFELGATAALALAAMIKPPLVLLLLPFVAVSVLRNSGRRLWAFFVHGGVAAAVVLPLAAPFLGLHNPFGGVAENYAHGYFLSPSLFILSTLNNMHLLDVHVVALGLTWFVRAVFLVAFLAAIVMVIRLAWRDLAWPAAGAAFGWILLLAIISGPQARPWYFIWILPVAWVLPSVPRLAVAACAAVLPLFVSVAPESFGGIYDNLVLAGLALVAPALLVLMCWLIRDLLARAQGDVPLWRDAIGPNG
jgi:hypothetical protein